MQKVSEVAHLMRHGQAESLLPRQTAGLTTPAVETLVQCKVMGAPRNALCIASQLRANLVR